MIRRLWDRLRIWWKQPFPLHPGPQEKSHRAVPIELGFWLHADGTVYWRSRFREGDRRMDDPEIVKMVHLEYQRLVGEAKSKARLRKALGRLR